VLPDLSLFNNTLTPTLRDEIIATQKNDEGMGHMKRRMQEGDHASVRMQKGPFGSRKGDLCQRKKILRRRFWMKPICRDIPFVLGAPRCIMT
jgi:hypothetical protein